MAPTYIQHNPNVPTGRAAFVESFSRIRKPEPLQPGWKNKPTMMFASGPYVMVLVKRMEKDPDDPNQTYPAYWFDLVRVDNGMMQVIVDDRADATQRAAIEAVAHGKHTEPGKIVWNVFASTMSSILPTLVKHIDLRIDLENRVASVDVPGVARGTVAPITN